MNPLQQAIRRACSDADYRIRLLANPRKALAESGIDVPELVEVRVHEGTENKIFVVLPAAKSVELGKTWGLPTGPVANVPAGLELTWQESPMARCSTLVAIGRIDGITAPALRRALEGSLVDVNLDLSGVDHLSSAGIGALLAALHCLKGHDCTLRLVLVPDPIRNVLEVSGMSELFEIHGLTEYINNFPKGAHLLFGGMGPTSAETHRPRK